MQHATAGSFVGIPGVVWFWILTIVGVGAVDGDPSLVAAVGVDLAREGHAAVKRAIEEGRASPRDGCPPKNWKIQNKGP